MYKNLLFYFLTISILLVSCSTPSAEKKLALAYEAEKGNEVEFNTFEEGEPFTYTDSISILQDTLDKKIEAYLARLDTAEAQFNKSTETAKDGKANNNFGIILDAEFDKVINRNKMQVLEIQNKREAVKINGEGTPLEGDFKKIEYLKSLPNDTLYNTYVATLEKDEETISKTYLYNLENSKIVGTK